MKAESWAVKTNVMTVCCSAATKAERWAVKKAVMICWHLGTDKGLELGCGVGWLERV